jgi:preprotein translocase subunit YajC
MIRERYRRKYEWVVKQVLLRIPSPTRMKEYKNTSSKLQRDDKVMITVL